MNRRDRVREALCGDTFLDNLVAGPLTTPADLTRSYERLVDIVLERAEREPWGLAEVALYTDVVPTTASHRIRAGSAGHPMAYAHLRSGPLVDADEVREWAAANPDRCGTRSPVHTPGVPRVNP